MHSPLPIDEPTQISKACGKPQAPHTNVDPMVVSEQHGKAPDRSVPCAHCRRPLLLSLGLRELWLGLRVAGGGGEINPARYDEVM